MIDRFDVLAASATCRRRRIGEYAKAATIAWQHILNIEGPVGATMGRVTPISTQTQRQSSTTASNEPASNKSASTFIDNRPQATAQRQLQELSDNSPKTRQLRMLRQLVQTGRPAQRVAQNAERPNGNGLESEIRSASGTVQLVPFKPESAAKTLTATVNPGGWPAGGTFTHTSNPLGYPTTAATKARDNKGGGSVTSNIEPNGMKKWHGKKLLPDPTPGKGSQALTKMHAINSHLYGPNDESNILLGSASANDKHSDEVEEPIKNYLKKKNRAVHYSVAVTYGHPGFVNSPAHAALTSTEQTEFANWKNHAIAHTINCQAIYYQKSSAGWEASAPETHAIDALTTDHKKIGGYRAAKKQKVEKYEKKRTKRKMKNTALYQGIVEALIGLGGGTPQTVKKYIDANHLGSWTPLGIRNMMVEMKGKALLLHSGGKYQINKRT